MIGLHLHPVFADVFPIFRKSHSCDQLLFGKSGGLLDGLIDQLDKLLLELFEFIIRKKIPIGNHHSEEVVFATGVLLAIFGNTKFIM